MPPRPAEPTSSDTPVDNSDRLLPPEMQETCPRWVWGRGLEAKGEGTYLEGTSAPCHNMAGVAGPGAGSQRLGKTAGAEVSWA